jgi:SAM-dependent methyltransferase
MSIIYDRIGSTYSSTRAADPGLEKQIHRHLAGARNLVNIGAGTGSYEPENIPVVAVEPSATMVKQRTPNKAGAIRAFADALPFADTTFSNSLSVLTVHHWKNRQTAFAEIRRVVTGRAVFVTWDPESTGFWLTRDYFPELLDIDRPKFPPLSEFEESFASIKVMPMLIPHDCIDGFLGAYWRRPHYYLDAGVRAGMSTFAEIDHPGPTLERLASDLESGRWHKKNAAILESTELDLGYRIVIADIGAAYA